MEHVPQGCRGEVGTPSKPPRAGRTPHDLVLRLGSQEREVGRWKEAHSAEWKRGNKGSIPGTYVLSPAQRPFTQRAVDKAESHQWHH